MTSVGMHFFNEGFCRNDNSSPSRSSATLVFSLNNFGESFRIGEQRRGANLIPAKMRSHVTEGFQTAPKHLQINIRTYKSRACSEM